MSRVSRKQDRKLMLGLAKSLSVSSSKVKRDGCGDWIISSRHGQISTDGAVFYVYLRSFSGRHWTFVKRKLCFLLISQDGDDEGVLKMVDIPGSDQAAIVRRTLRLRKTPQLTEEQRRSLVARLNLPFRKRDASSNYIEVPEVPATPLAAAHRKLKKEQKAEGPTCSGRDVRRDSNAIKKHED
jgi:hypothetical protein